MNKQFTVRQHWVPQFFLNHFIKKNDQGKLYVTDVKRYYDGSGEYLPVFGQPAKPERKAIKDVAYIEYLYSNFDGAKLTNDLEDGFFLKMETSLGKIFNKINDGTIDLSRNSEDRVKLALFTASLHLRHPRMVAAVLGVERDNAPLGPGLDAIKDREEFRKLQEFTPVLASTLEKRDWQLLRFENDALVTSDTPVFVTEGPTLEQGSFESSTSTVYLPICHSRLLVMRGEDLKPLPYQKPNETFPFERLWSVDADIYNRFIINFSERYVYSSKPLPKELAADISP